MLGIGLGCRLEPVETVVEKGNLEGVCEMSMIEGSDVYIVNDSDALEKGVM